MTMHFQETNKVMIIYTQEVNRAFGLTEYGEIANIIIAILTLVLAFYIFVYQRSNDKKSDLSSIEAHRKNIKLSWFKELVIEPKFENVLQFYENLYEIKVKINSNDLSDEEKINLINYIKAEQSILRKSFLNLLQFISADLFKALTYNLDILTDTLTKVISDDELKLNNEKTYEREIHSKIQQSNYEFLSLIFNYSG